MYNSRVMKLQSAKCPWCAGNCLLRVRCLRWYCCDAVDCGGSSWCSVWSGLFIILLNSWSSHFSSSQIFIYFISFIWIRHEVHRNKYKTQIKEQRERQTEKNSYTLKWINYYIRGSQYQNTKPKVQVMTVAVLPEVVSYTFWNQCAYQGLMRTHPSVSLHLFINYIFEGSAVKHQSINQSINQLFPTTLFCGSD